MNSQWVRVSSYLVAAVMMAVSSGPVWAESVQDKRVTMFKKSGENIQAVFKTHLPNGDFESIRSFAEEMAEWGGVLPDYFPENATSEGARPEIWQNWNDFEAKAGDFTAAAQALVVATHAGNAETIGGAVKALGATCKACHQKYRYKK